KKAIKEYENINSYLIKLMGDLGDFLTFLILPDGNVFKGKFYKNVKKQGNIVEISRLNNKELVSFIGRRFVRAGKRIKKSYISEIISRFSYLNKNSEIDLYEIVNTVDK